MTQPDKELWDKVGFNSKYEYIPIPISVAKIIKRKYKTKYGDAILLCHWYQDKPTDERVVILHYVRYDCGTLTRAEGGFCSSLAQGETLQDLLITLAEQIRDTWPQTAIKKRIRYDSKRKSRCL